MSPTTTAKKTDTKRTEPRKKVHRKIVELTLNEGTQRMLLQHIEQLQKSVIRAQQDLHNFVMENVVEGVIEAANAKLEPAMQQTSLTLYSANGDTRFSINQQISRQFDDRAQQATALITDFINDHKLIEVSPEMFFLMNMLEAMLFGASRKKQFRHTPELAKFMSMENDDLPDPRLIQAKDILNEAFFTHRSKWYYGIDKFNEEQHIYQKLEDWLNA